MAFLVTVSKKLIEREQGPVERWQIADFVRSEHAANIDGDRRKAQKCEFGLVARSARGGTRV